MRPLHLKAKKKTRENAAKLSSLEPVHEELLLDEERVALVLDVGRTLSELCDAQFPKSSVLEYAVLKAHIIVDYCLLQFLRCTSVVLVDPEDINFSFAQKLRVARMQGFCHSNLELLRRIEILTKARNQVAHEFSLSTQLVDDI